MPEPHWSGAALISFHFVITNVASCVAFLSRATLYAALGGQNEIETEKKVQGLVIRITHYYTPLWCSTTIVHHNYKKYCN